MRFYEYPSTGFLFKSVSSRENDYLHKQRLFQILGEAPGVIGVLSNAGYRNYSNTNPEFQG